MSRRRVKRPQPTTDRRSPEDRLEAFVREQNLDRAERMLSRIGEDLDAAPEPAPWIAGARTLSERLIISEDAFYYLVRVFSDCLVYAASETDPELVRLRDEMEIIERAGGLRGDQHWHPDDAPAEWRLLNDAWERHADDVVRDHLRSTGNGDVAELWQNHPDDFDRRTNDGRVSIWGPDEDGDGGNSGNSGNSGDGRGADDRAYG